MLKSKIHRATVTDAHVHYEGSITIDRELLDSADIREYEEVHVWNVTNGERLVTYAIAGMAGSGIVAMNGAAALKVKKGDIIIVGCFADYDAKDLVRYRPRRVFVDAGNHIIKKSEGDECC